MGLRPRLDKRRRELPSWASGSPKLDVFIAVGVMRRAMWTQTPLPTDEVTYIVEIVGEDELFVRLLDNYFAVLEEQE
jgi:hypothetical protein